MAGFSLAGVLCTITNAVPIDGGTQTLTAMPTGGAVGEKPGPELDRDDPEVARHLELIEGLRHPLVPYTLESLRRMRAANVAMLNEASSEFGEHSKSVRLLRRTITVVDELIREQAFQDHVTSLPDKIDGAGDVLQRLLDLAERPDGGGVSLDDLRRALIDRVGLERQSQLLGLPDNSRHNLGDQMLRAGKVSYGRHKTELVTLLSKGRGAPGSVSDSQVQDAVGKLLGDARQMQLMGGEDPPETATLLRETALQWYGRKSEQLRKAYDSKAPASVVARAESDCESAKRALSMLGIPVPVRVGSVDIGPVELR